MFWWLLVACPKKDLDPAVRRDELLKLADVAWEQRGSIGLDTASQPLLEAYGLAPTFPGVLWRIARLRTAEGMAADDPDIARSSFAEARATGASCIEGQAGFVERRSAEGWGPALTDLTVDRAPCVAWTAFPWVRWMAIQGGDAASLDLDPIDALLARISGDQRPEVESVAVWAQGLLFAVRPIWAGRDLAAARETLEQAIRLNRRDLTPLVDLYDVVRQVGTPEEQGQLYQRILSRPTNSPEDVRAKAQINVETQTSPPPSVGKSPG